MIPDSFHLSIPPSQLIGFHFEACYLMAARWLQLWPSWLCSRQREKGSRSEGQPLCKDFHKCPAYFFFRLVSSWPELIHIPISSHKDMKVNIFRLIHCSPKQYQGSVHWKQGENRPPVGNHQPLPPPQNRWSYGPDLSWALDTTSWDCHSLRGKVTKWLGTQNSWAGSKVWKSASVPHSSSRPPILPDLSLAPCCRCGPARAQAWWEECVINTSSSFRRHPRDIPERNM